ncbi:lipopolysaccharide biosynthesis protein [Robiginitalea aurantiaca]|uniref:Polysaccharide biosynthesis C-terminal domain-containing protein n=1 Tax=Robiginitalea aurantiaca TaxID=3056915 RepID=A0ABT7WG21_9FLAO|nr:polysaccharide biosynthesis C-terminal domain-containing protein [Robiginitalea aurantiaca]MDM9631858.1 polysaccharide biosynthesis C-terminal domain-containing protein [Robiginitalea aurantiaca]
MGIVLRQTAANTAITYLGFALGAVNTLFLYTRVMSDAYFGLVGVLLSTATLLMPVMSFGIPNTLVKFYSAYKERGGLQDFLSLVFILPLLIIIPLGAYSYFANDVIGGFLARKNIIVGDYVWHIFWIGLFMAYFEIFFAWSKVCLKSTLGTFLKEVFIRIGVSILLLLLYMGYLSEGQFLIWLVSLYGFRVLLMAWHALRLQPFHFHLALPDGYRDVLKYSSLIILGGSVSVVLLEIDRFMINQYIRIENVAYYTVAVFIATVIIVPFRSMNQITYPLTASLMNAGDLDGLKKLYKRSSLTLLAITALIFIGILLNLGDLYLLLPENYRGGYYVVLFLGLVRLFDAFLGINTAILYNSKYYGTLLMMGVILALLTILLNAWLIPTHGLTGAAMATLISAGLYNFVKMLFVKWKFGLTPWSLESLKVFGIALGTFVLFYWMDFPFHPIVNITLKSVLIAVVYLGVLLKFRVSEDLWELFRKGLKK